MVTLTDVGGKSKKPQVSQGVFSYFGNALLALATVSRMGANKHNAGKMPTAWRDYPITTYADALGRHQLNEVTDGLYDRESHYLHAAHAAWNALAKLELLLVDNPLEEITVERVDADPTPSTPHTADCVCYQCKPVKTVTWGVSITTERRTASGCRRVYYKTVCINQRTGLGRRKTDIR